MKKCSVHTPPKNMDTWCSANVLAPHMLDSKALVPKTSYCDLLTGFIETYLHNQYQGPWGKAKERWRYLHIPNNSFHRHPIGRWKNKKAKKKNEFGKHNLTYLIYKMLGKSHVFMDFIEFCSSLFFNLLNILKSLRSTSGSIKPHPGMNS